MKPATAMTIRIGALVILAVTGVTLLAGQDGATRPAALDVYRNMAADGAVPLPVIEGAARSVRQSDGDRAMLAFLLNHAQRFPDDPANGYIMTVAGDMYVEAGSTALARQYFRRALLGYPDVVVRGVPAHRIAINRLLSIVNDSAERVQYLTYLSEQYSDDVDSGLIAWNLAQAYEGAGRWDDAYEQYREFLRYPSTTIPGNPEEHERVARRVSFWDSPRDWTQRDLDRLVTEIKNALWAQNPTALLRHRAGVSFFTMSWEQRQGDANSEIPTFDIAAFLLRSRVRFAADLDITSNAREAYLRTWGWSHRIPTWYFYFRRVDFPADPEIHGTWEWAGIYFGESF